MAYTGPDHLTHANANALANRIQAYWADRGKSPLVYVVELPGSTETAPLFGVRSNMVNGTPCAS